jgi:hypothetical protein
MSITLLAVTADVVESTVPTMSPPMVTEEAIRQNRLRMKVFSTRLPPCRPYTLLSSS